MVAAVVLAGCSLVSQPDPDDWTATSQRSLESAASAVATTRVTLREHDAGDLWDSYAVVLLADAEEAVGTASDDVALLQTPPGEKERAERVLDLLAEAEDAVRAAREAMVDDEPVTGDRLRSLDDLRDRLMTEAGR